MPMKPEAFQRALDSQELPPVILLAGGEPLLVLEAADAVRTHARELGFSEREVLEAGSRFDWAELAGAGANLSLFASRRLIDLRLPGGRAGTAGSKALTAWVEDPPPDTLLLITTDEWSRKHEVSWVKKLEKAGWFVPFWPVRVHDMPRWVQARCRSRGLDIDASAARLLVERTEGNLLAAAQEIDKLAMLDLEGRLDARKLSALVADSARFNVFALVEAAFAGNAVRVLHMLRGLRNEGAEPLMMLGWLVRQIEQALRLLHAADFAAQARQEGLWQSRLQLFQSTLDRLAPADWARCMTIAQRIDAIVKGRAAGDEWRELDRLLLLLADPAAGRQLAQPA